MRICRTLPLATLIVAMPLGGVAQIQQFSPPADSWLDLLQGREVEWLFSKPESLPDGFGPWPGPKQTSTGKTIPPSAGPSAPPAGCGFELFFPLSSDRPCFGYPATRDFRTRERLVSQTYFSLSVRNAPTTNFRGDFWQPGELDRLIGPR